MCKNTVNTSLSILKFVSDFFVTNKMFGKLDDVVFSNYDTVFVNSDYDNVTLFGDNMDLAIVDLKNVVLGVIKALDWGNKIEISKELMFAQWNTKS